MVPASAVLAPFVRAEAERGAVESVPSLVKKGSGLVGQISINEVIFTASLRVVVVISVGPKTVEVQGIRLKVSFVLSLAGLSSHAGTCGDFKGEGVVVLVGLGYGSA